MPDFIDLNAVLPACNQAKKVEHEMGVEFAIGEQAPIPLKSGTSVQRLSRCWHSAQGKQAVK